MPKTDEKGRPRKSELPDTVARSSKKAQRTFAEAHDSALEEYGSEESAHRVAYSALKHSYERVGDRWVAKTKRGPSDERDRSGGSDASKKHLLQVACDLDIRGRSTMRKAELVDAIERANRKASRRSKRS
ncbi:ChaB family protein [Gordonia sp. PDNC005]|uniref:ChaB family protein n=1 Tax=unclassified Gordonia (in: high G+C Gram-positive bacteria) TaxID=2657482 RepID=UPI0019646D63|nr:ChaB family protein [Gordonia sp. PDNC005]QRY61302.1 ChaB family protein [Gordonia sp. PDNC005]